MSIWISRATRFAVPLAAAATVAACTLTSDGGVQMPSAARGVERAALAQGAITVAGPRGYCVDTSASRTARTSTAAVLRPCATGSGGSAAVLTVAVSGDASSDGEFSEAFPILASFFRSDQGQAALSRSGNASGVTVQRSFSRGEVFYLKVVDVDESGALAVERDYWRAILALRGRIVSLTVLGLRDRPLSDAEKQRTLEAFVQRMRAVNGADALP